MNEEIIQEESQEGISLEYKEEIRDIEEHREEKAKREEYIQSKDIVRYFLFHELISKPVSLRR